MSIFDKMRAARKLESLEESIEAKAAAEDFFDTHALGSLVFHNTTRNHIVPNSGPVTGPPPFQPQHLGDRMDNAMKILSSVMQITAWQLMSPDEIVAKAYELADEFWKQRTK